MDFPILRRIYVKLVIILIIIIVLILLVIRQFKNGDPYVLAGYLHTIIGNHRNQQNQREVRNHKRYLRNHKQYSIKDDIESSPPSYCSAWATSHSIARNLNDDLMLNFIEIRREILTMCQIYEGLPMIELDDIQRKSFVRTAPNWKVIWVKLFDQWGPLASRMPTLKKIIEKHPELILIHISVMDPGTVLPRHEGISPAVVRYHLPIQIPHGDNVYLNLDNHKVNWIVGEGFVFDDCLPHGVIMKPDINMKRVIIFADIPRTFDGIFSSLYESLCSYFHAHIRHNIHIQKIKEKIVNHQNTYTNKYEYSSSPLALGLKSK